MAQYIKNPKDSVVHVIDTSGCGEFTFCGRDHCQEDSGGFEGELCNGPSTCAECQENIAEIRDAMNGVRFNVSQ